MALYLALAFGAAILVTGSGSRSSRIRLPVRRLKLARMRFLACTGDRRPAIGRARPRREGNAVEDFGPQIPCCGGLRRLGASHRRAQLWRNGRFPARPRARRALALGRPLSPGSAELLVGTALNVHAVDTMSPCISGPQFER
jgi:hypothetical protein